MDRPRWLEDEAEITQLLHRLLDMLDKQPLSERKQVLRIRLDKKHLPELFRHDPQSDHEWAMLKSLSEDYALFDITHSRKRKPFAAEFDAASLVFNPPAEGLLRNWLQRPSQAPYPQQWHEAIDRYAGHFADRGQSLSQRPLRLADKSAEQVVAGFTGLAELIDKGLSLRQLSARGFWGHSKFLDAREELLETLFANAHIRPRPIMVNVFLPAEIHGVLFIENQDSFINGLSADNLTQHALVYLSGFQGSAKRIREHTGASLYFHSSSNRQQQTRFENWWFEDQDENWPGFFWGDLDYSGMAILKALRQRFPHTQAWQDGYAPMLTQLNNGQGHRAALAGKDEQQDPGQTGCPYADNILLPALRQSGRFIDQEWL